MLAVECWLFLRNQKHSLLGISLRAAGRHRSPVADGLGSRPVLVHYETPYAALDRKALALSCEATRGMAARPRG